MDFEKIKMEVQGIETLDLASVVNLVRSGQYGSTARCIEDGVEKTLFKWLLLDLLQRLEESESQRDTIFEWLIEKVSNDKESWNYPSLSERYAASLVARYCAEELGFGEEVSKELFGIYSHSINTPYLQTTEEFKDYLEQTTKWRREPKDTRPPREKYLYLLFPTESKQVEQPKNREIEEEMCTNVLDI